MSVVYAEGFNRATFTAIANGKGIMGKARDIRCVTNASFPVSIVNRGGRRWITTPNPTFLAEQAQQSPSYLSIWPAGATADEAMRASCGMPPFNGASRVVVTWKVDATGQQLLAGNSNYFASVGNTVMAFASTTTVRLPSRLARRSTPQYGSSTRLWALRSL
ncbi:hypothetical protein D3C86_1508790 [compost metagenome]